MTRSIKFTALVLVFLWQFVALAEPQEEEFRAFWADAWHTGFQKPVEVVNLIRDLRTANCNAVFVQVRKRGDAYFKDSPYDPPAKAVTANFDPLAEVIKLAHDTNAGPRIEVHAWIVVYPIATVMHPTKAKSSGPVVLAKFEPKHIFNLHPEWLSESDASAKRDENQYFLDPGHPGVQKYIFDVVMDIVSRYDLDGIHLDHLRYPNEHWGYNPVAISRFNSMFNRTGKPASNDAEWSRFRRNQVTQLLRMVYLSSIAEKPQIKVSVSTVTWTPGVTSEAQWTSRTPYTSALQDWRSWMEEGILDINVPMLFFKESSSLFARAYADWSGYAKDHKYGRQVVIGQAGYLNSGQETCRQLTIAKAVTASGGKADGVAFYSYAIPSKAEHQRDLFFQTESNNPGLSVMFGKAAPTPKMQWKTNPTEGHLRGFVTGGNRSNALDGATVMLTGPVARRLATDATGFFGAVDLPPGHYELVVSFPKCTDRTNVCSIATGKVTTQVVWLAGTSRN